MAGRTIHKLSDTAIRAAKASGRHSDGGGLYLAVSSSGAKSWVYMWTPNGGSRREMGLGPYPAVSLATARTRAAANRAMVENGLDPIAERDRMPEVTFGQCADQFIESVQGTWRNEKHVYQWRQTLGTKCELIRHKRVSQITTSDIERVLLPIWTTQPETATRLRSRIERVLNYAKVKGWREGENPAAWRDNLRNLLPKPERLIRGHHPAMPYADVPAFIVQLRSLEGLSARALELTILTAARSGETIGAGWSEIDLAEKLWTVPAGRMKAGEEHTVPLSARAVEILQSLQETATSTYVFPSADRKKAKPLSNMAMLMLLRRSGHPDLTVHGFRSAFRDWCGDQTTFAREVAEAALAHKVGNEVEQAYRRGSALEKRRKLMDAWARYCATTPKNNVVPIGKRTA